MTGPRNPAANPWPLGDQDGYDIGLCACDEGPYLGARKAGTPCCCERCGFITLDQWEHIQRAMTPTQHPAPEVVGLAEVLAAHEARWTTHGDVRYYQVIHCGDYRCDWSLRQKRSMTTDACYDAHRVHVAERVAAHLRTMLDAVRAEAKAEERERIARCIRTEAHGRNDAAWNRALLFAAGCALARYDQHDAHSFCANRDACPRCSLLVGRDETGPDPGFASMCTTCGRGLVSAGEWCCGAFTPPAEPDAGDVGEALAKVVNPDAFDGNWQSSQETARWIARAILASDWLTNRECKAAERALREAADALDDHTDCDCEDGDHLTRLATSKWLRARADREAGR